MTNTDSLNKPDPMAEDELESILHLNGCQQRTAGHNEALGGKDLDMEDMERLEKLTLQEVRAYTTNKIIERLEMIKATDSTRWVTNPSGMAGISFNVIDEAIAELRKTL